ASVRAYRGGPQTLDARRQLVLDYLNSVPLTAAPGHGEVHGFGDALWVWFAEDIEGFSASLNGQRGLPAQALALRQGLSLVIAQRRPSWYLLAGRAELQELVDSHIRLLANEQRIDPRLAEAAPASPLVFRNWQTQPLQESIEADKAIRVTRSQLAGMLGQSIYNLDRLDMSAASSLDLELQRAVSAFRESLADEESARQHGLLGETLLSARQAAEGSYSFTLMERTATGNQVRVQTDTTGQPFDLNQSSKLELGSTAKLRVLTSYLEIIAELNSALTGEPDAATARDPLSAWAAEYLRANANSDLPTMLDAALPRRYSASPWERFPTGARLQSVAYDNQRRPTVQQALQESINLPFVRLLRDIIRYSQFQIVEDADSLLTNDRDPRRKAWLQTFADREGRVYLQRFWRRYAGMDERQRFDRLLRRVQPIAPRLSVGCRMLYPAADFERFSAFLPAHVRAPQKPERIERLHQAYRP